MIQNLLLSTYLSLKAHKLRVFLTMLGIIIGISSVVTIASLGEGLRQQTIQLSETANINEVTIQHVFEPEEDDEFFYYSEPTSFEFSRVDMKRVQKIEGVTSVLPDYGENMGMDGATETVYMEIDYFGQIAYTQLTPSTHDAQLKFGRNITPADANRDVIVLSHDVLDYGISIDDPQKMIGRAVSINGYMFEVIGIKKPYDYQSTSISDSDDFFTALNSEVSRNSYNELTKFKPIRALRVKFDENADRFLTTEQVIEVLSENHPTEEGIFQEDTTNQQFQEEMEAYLDGLIGFLMAITAISLLVGGIGVMNIMYVSVTQRKREIGIRRAIGAKPRNILFQFVLEAGVITLIGGIIGLMLGYGIAVVVGQFMDLTPILTIQSILLATSVSTLTGLFFGIMPALSAAKMDPIKAIYK